ncbi:MZT2A protein, partial [Grallaria varia]|nr:MZT2A protein [Grallaria varia]
AAMSEAPAGMAAVAISEARLRRKQLLSAEEAELFELAQAAGSGDLGILLLSPLLDPLLWAVCPLPPSASAFVPTAAPCSCFAVWSWSVVPTGGELSSSELSKSIWRNKTSSAVSGTQVLAERSSREGSAQRMPRQPSASRMQKAGASGKNTGGGSN